MKKQYTWFLTGLAFAALWPSASTATKVGLTVAQPLVIAQIRFFMAAAILLFISHVIRKHPLPSAKMYRQTAIYGLLNITIYLGCYVIAMQQVTAGIGSLSVATNPVLISFLSVFILKRKLTWPLVLSLMICSVGVGIAAWPLLGNAFVTTKGLLILFVSMISYSVAAIYFSSREWGDVSLMTINGWQTLFGAIFLLPFTWMFYHGGQNHFNQTFWFSVAWLAIPVSIISVQLWLRLLRIHPVRAGLWLFLCPMFGIMLANWWLGDVISIYTIFGAMLVVAGLFFSKMDSSKSEVVFD
jgi:drug/metabolite transporter (DMT)-like permease